MAGVWAELPNITYRENLQDTLSFIVLLDSLSSQTHFFGSKNQDGDQNTLKPC